MNTQQLPVLIAGAGIAGLTLAQALKKEQIPFRIFERDENVDSRGHGWGITIFVMDAFAACLPASLLARLPEVEVDPEEARKNAAMYSHVNLETGQSLGGALIRNTRRVNREKLRKLLLDGVNVEWGKAASGFAVVDGGVEVCFTDGSSASGRLLVGADGASSRIRKALVPDNWQLRDIPARFLGVTLSMTAEEVAPIRAIDPVLFQGTHPDNGSFIWYSLLDTPLVNKSQETGHPIYRVQFNMSWLYRSPADEVPSSKPAQLAMLRERASHFWEGLRKPLTEMSDDTEVVEVKLRDWPCEMWPNHGGMVTMVGDACHPMTMYRGEAANHAITDVQNLQIGLVKVFRSFGGDPSYTQQKMIDDFEREMRARTSWSVRMSRQACIECHDFSMLSKENAMTAVNEDHKVAVDFEVVSPPAVA